MRGARYLQRFANVPFIAKDGQPSNEAAESRTQRNEP
jgi:hypothetical protein